MTMANPPKRRWYQFSLRTLLIGVTLLAAQCGFVTWVIRDRERLIHERDEAEDKARNAQVQMIESARVEYEEIQQIRRLAELESRRRATDLIVHPQSSGGVTTASGK